MPKTGNIFFLEMKNSEEDAGDFEQALTDVVAQGAMLVGFGGGIGVLGALLNLGALLPVFLELAGGIVRQLAPRDWFGPPGRRGSAPARCCET